MAGNLNKKLLSLHLFLSSLYHKETKNPDTLMVTYDFSEWNDAGVGVKEQ